MAGHTPNWMKSQFDLAEESLEKQIRKLKLSRYEAKRLSDLQIELDKLKRGV